MIEIVSKNGDMARYSPEAYTDYRCDGKHFIVIKDGQWIGLYDLDAVEYIEVINEPIYERAYNENTI